MEENLLLISQNLQDAIILIKNNKIVHKTNSYNDIFNNKLDENLDVKGNILKVISNEHKHIIDSYKYEKAFDKNFKIELDDKSHKWIWMKSKPIIENESVNGTIIILSDITRTINDEVNKKQSRLKFVSNITHEFKTPLNLIFSSIQLLNKKMNLNNPCSNEYLKKYLGIVNQNSYRILKLVNNISDDTKIDSGNDELNLENVDLIRFVENICQSILSLISINNMEIVFDTDIEELTVAVDIEKMEKIILNLLSNSIKFRKDAKGKVSVEIYHDNEFINIKVRDNGIGIPKDKIDTIFSKYTRINDNNSLVKEGSGIGLSLVWDYVNLHLGSVDVDSEYSQWTEFNIKIPNKTIKEEKLKLYNYEQERIEKIKVEFSDIYKGEY
ncbi:MAG: HAMP domain-containing sensor histidine kinase [Romboutsia sp.]